MMCVHQDPGQKKYLMVQYVGQPCAPRHNGFHDYSCLLYLLCDWCDGALVMLIQNALKYRTYW